MRAVGENKRCSVCQEWKLVGDFYCEKSKPDGLRAPCKSCDRERLRQRRRQNPNEDRERLRVWREQNPERVFEQQQRYREKNPEKCRERAFKAQITREAKYRWMKGKLLELGIEV